MKKWPILLCPFLLFGCQPKHSPGHAPGTPESTESQATVAIPKSESFVGLSLEAAESKAEKADLPHRVVKKDGEDLRVTRDYRPERLNFTVEKGIVTHVTNG